MTLHKTHHNNSHQPVLLERTLEYLKPKRGETYLDLTAGYGGHAKHVLARIQDASNMTLVDRDDQAIASLKDFEAAGARLIHRDYQTAASLLAKAGEQFDLVLADLGVSSPQLESAERGFSFLRTGPLDMRMDRREQLSALEVVNEWPQSKLEDIIKLYGDESRARTIAEAIVRRRPLKSTAELADTIKAVIPSHGKIHPATRTFQAIRIAVNRELDQLARTLTLIPELLKPGGRVVLISFHSLEDRLIKQFLREQSASGYEARLKLLTKKPILGSQHDESNPRARSAKLRAAVKINT